MFPLLLKFPSSLAFPPLLSPSLSVGRSTIIANSVGGSSAVRLMTSSDWMTPCVFLVNALVPSTILL